MSDWKTKLALLVTVIWAASYIISVMSNNYTGVGAVTPVMVIAAGYLLGSEFTRRNGNT